MLYTSNKRKILSKNR